jgi:rod shape determining protein RodA
MFRKLFWQFRQLDLVLLSVTGLLAILGLLMVWSTTRGTTFESLFIRQMIFLGIGFSVYLILAFFDYKVLRRVAWLAYLAVVAGLIGVLFFGADIRGARRWFQVGPLQLQIAEFAKPMLVLVVAAFLEKERAYLVRFRTMIRFFLLILIPALLILLEPDAGSAGVVFLSSIALLLFARLPGRNWVAIVLLFAVIVGASWSFLLQDYQKQRVLSYFAQGNIEQTAYNVRQSLIAIGSGGLFGQGLGKGLISQLRYLPEKHTDFIFASAAEELGLVGTSFILAAFLVLFLRLMRIAQQSHDMFGLYLAIGIFTWLFLQTAVNIGVTLGLLPVTGIPLPLVSYGGSSLIATMGGLGVAQSVHRKAYAMKFQ